MLDLRLRTVLLTLFVFWIGIATPLPAQDTDPAQQLVLRVYPVADLVQAIPDFPFTGGQLPTVGTNQALTPTPAAGGAFGGGGGGGGGGFFSVPDPATVVASAAAGQIVGVQATHQNRPRFTIQDLQAAIYATVTPDAWVDMGGEAVCKELGTMLVIRQRPTAHQEIEQLLASVRQEGGVARPITVDAIWLALDSQQLASLFVNDAAGENSPALVDPKVLSTLAEQSHTYRGRINCFSDQTVHLVAGERRTVVTGATSTIGFSAAGYMLQTAIPNIGILLETRTSLIPQGDAAIVHVLSTITRWQGETEPLEVSSVIGPEGAAASPSIPSSPQAAATQPRRSGTVSTFGLVTATIDRVRIGTHEMKTSVRLPLGKPVLVGGLSSSDMHVDEKHDEKQIYLMLKISTADSASAL